MTREFWLAIRQALLMIVDAIERLPEVDFRGPRTAELRKTRKEL